MAFLIGENWVSILLLIALAAEAPKAKAPMPIMWVMSE